MFTYFINTLSYFPYPLSHLPISSMGENFEVFHCYTFLLKGTCTTNNNNKPELQKKYQSMKTKFQKANLMKLFIATEFLCFFLENVEQWAITHTFVYLLYFHVFSGTAEKLGEKRKQKYFMFAQQHYVHYWPKALMDIKILSSESSRLCYSCRKDAETPFCVAIVFVSVPQFLLLLVTFPCLRHYIGWGFWCDTQFIGEWQGD